MKYFLLFLLFYSPFLNAQDKQKSKAQKGDWSIDFHFTIPQDKMISDALYHARDNTGFTNPFIQQGSCVDVFCNVTYKQSAPLAILKDDNTSFNLRVSRLIKDFLSVDLLIGWNKMGHVYGNNGDLFGLQPNISSFELKLASTFYSSMVFVNATDDIRLGIGPMLSKQTLRAAGRPFGKTEFKKTKLGAIVEADVRFPRKTAFYFDFGAQYQLASASVYDAINLPNESASTGNIEIPSSFLAFSFGIGVRIKSKH